MAIVLKKFVLGKLSVEEAMRRQVIGLSQKAAIDQSINYMIKYKVNALLMTDGEDKPSGVVSKTDIMGAYYAALPIDSPLEHIMNAPPLCLQERSEKNHRRIVPVGCGQVKVGLLPCLCQQSHKNR